MAELLDKAKNFVADKVANMKKPEASITDVDVGQVGWDGIKFDAKVSVTNPYGVPIPICEISYTLKSAGRLDPHPLLLSSIFSSLFLFVFFYKYLIFGIRFEVAPWDLVNSFMIHTFWLIDLFIPICFNGFGVWYLKRKKKQHKNYNGAYDRSFVLDIGNWDYVGRLI